MEITSALELIHKLEILFKNGKADRELIDKDGLIYILEDNKNQIIECYIAPNFDKTIHYEDRFIIRPAIRNDWDCYTYIDNDQFIDLVNELVEKLVEKRS